MKPTTKLDRNLQLHVLQALADLEPYGTYNALEEAAPAGIDLDTLVANLLYLEEHGLIWLGFERSGGIGGEDDYVEVRETRITAKGQDFLALGGLTAILDVMTIRLHDDTIKSLIEAKIHEADLPQPDKKRYLDALRELPAESTKHLVMKLIDAGLASAPTAWSTIQNALSAAL